MSWIDRAHQHAVYGRRIAVLAEALAPRIPPSSSVLDVGCGDGLLSRRVAEARPDVSIEGVDVLLRPTAFIPVQKFDGRRLPFDDDSFDVAMLVDVLHHADDPAALLAEAARVSRGTVLIKDHRRDGFLAAPTLRFMDRVGNARHGVALPGNYLSEREWRRAFTDLNLTVIDWSTDVPLYPPWAAWIFGRSLHFVAALAKSPLNNARGTASSAERNRPEASA